MTDIFVRAFTDFEHEGKGKYQENHNPNIQLIFDTETTTDQYQNLLFGSCLVRTKISSGFKGEWYLFYGNISEENRKTIEQYGKEHNINVMSVRGFVDDIFYHYAYRIRAEVIGFNLPFDVSRLAIGYGISRKARDGFSFKLSEYAKKPRIRIQSIDQKRTFISFLRALQKKSDRKFRHYSGYFVDLKTLTFALTDKSHTLDSACNDFNVSRKTHPEEHGKITEKYIDYNINDVKITSELYQSALVRYKMFNLPDSVNKLYSPASIGKAYLRKMGIHPFTQMNPDFPKEILGYVMSAYYGGRAEVRIKDRAIPITNLDFTSMYPTVYTLLGLDRFLKAKDIGYKHDKEGVAQFIGNLRIEDLRNRDTWQREEMHSIVLIKPNDDLFPIRAEYSREDKNIGMNYLVSSKPFWYSIQDVIASFMLTGKVPEIVDAITFYSEGIQEGLKDVEISGITVKSDDDFIKRIIEERIRVKKSNSPQRDQIQLILKIIANATSYGIYIEENQESLKKPQEISVYSSDQFAIKSDKIEKQGEHFNPIVAVLLTSSARLILSMAERLAVKNDGYTAYMDTDSMFVKPDRVREIQEFFRQLNPYSTETEMFKIEEDDEGRPLDKVLFYGISAKRYCLYKMENDEINIKKYSTHGLGHLLKINGEQTWKDILSKKFDDYADKIAVSQITITKPSILNRFKAMNDNRPLDKKIKPFNFMLVGSDVNGTIPSLPYRKDISEIQYSKFIDYRTGKSSHELPLPSNYYWKSIQDVLIRYVRHNDHKFDYVEGIAQRKHIVVDRIRYIGKESNNIDESMVFGLDEDSYLEYNNLKEFYDWVLSLRPKDVRDRGISERGLRNFKQKIRQGKGLKNSSKIARTLNEMYKSKKQEPRI
jgi:hypothetical protein